MQIVFSDSSRRIDLDVVVRRADATVGDLAAALAPSRPDLSLEADGRVIEPERRLDRAGIRCGAVVRLVPRPTSPPGEPPAAPAPVDGSLGLEAAVVGGLDAGERCALAPGAWPLGRDASTLALTHDTVSARHATLDVDADGGVEVADAGSLNGTWVAGQTVAERGVALEHGAVVRLGAVQVSVRPLLHRDRPATVGAPTHRGPKVPFNRPPRAAPPPAAPPLTPPEPIAPPGSVAPVGVAAVLGPVLAGGAMVAITRQPAFALLVLLSPVTAIATAIESRRRRRRGRRRDAARFRRELDALVVALDERASAERSRLDALIPDPAEVLRRVEQPSTRMWERRGGDADWLVLRVGVGATPWSPPVAGDPAHRPPEVAAAIGTVEHLVDAPVPIDLDDGGVVGVVGPRPAALALARSLLVQATAHHGPADLSVLVTTAPDRLATWDWVKWLPHLVDAEGAGRGHVAAGPAADAACRALIDVAVARRRDGDHAPAPTTLVIVDDEDLVEGAAPVRAVLRGRAGPVAGIVIAATDDRLPASCSSIVTLVDDDGTARVADVATGTTIAPVLATGMSDAVARRAARGLARYADPEQAIEGDALPDSVALLALLGLDVPTAEAVASRWRAAGADPPLATPLGVTDDGPLVVDLVRDGPHGLVAGTTGAGKSELLRSLVAGLAAGASPDDRTFVLVDFKGGSAFDACAALPHTVGLVTDLDAHLAERALRCLHAELRRRERVLRAAGASDLSALRRAPDAPTLPRLVVVVDEFATLKAELPDFVDSLVGIAQRGRSLGVHMVLATQRPSGAVSEAIRANTDLRVALRVQDPADSTDVVDVVGAARISRHRPGRALARLGPGDVVTVQTALSTGTTRRDGRAVDLRPFTASRSPAPPADPEALDETDLSRLVAACAAAHAASGQPPPRRPWPDPLPSHVTLETLPPSDQEQVVLALGDRPDDQVQSPVAWRPADGNLLLAGLPGSGTTTTLVTVALSWCRAVPPDRLHVYAIDAGTGGMAPLEMLAHCGSVVAVADRERQIRLFAELGAELERRRSGGLDDHPRILVLLDGVGPFRTEWEDAGSGVLEAFGRVFAEGIDVGIHVAAAADRPAALPAAARSLVRQQLLFALGDDVEYAAAGLRARDLPTFAPGRAIALPDGVEVQVARPADGVDAAIRALTTRDRAVRRPPRTIGALPRRPELSEVLDAIDLSGTPLRLPLGIGATALAPAGLLLHPGEHAVVAGPARSGRTTALVVAGLGAVHAGWPVVVVAGPRSVLAAAPWATTVDPARVDDLAAALAELGQAGDAGDAGPTMVLVDDAETVDLEGRALTPILGRPGVVVVAAGRADVLRGLYGHWTRTVRQSRVGVLLQPDVDLDGDLLGVRLPHRPPTAIGPGRGYLCEGGTVELLQVASPPAPSPRA